MLAMVDLGGYKVESGWVSAAILLLTFVAIIIVRRIVLGFFNLASSKLQNKPTEYKFIRHLVSAVILLIGLGVAVYIVPSMRALAISLFAGAGILAIIIGFASQAAFSNVISGIFIVIFKPFRVYDRIRIGENIGGVVEDITLRHTVIRDFENRMIIIPNSVISEEVIINNTMIDEKICRRLEYGISYDSDMDRAMEIIREECMENHLSIDNRTEDQIAEGDEIVEVYVIRWDDSAIVLRAYVWCATASEAFIMGNELNYSIKKRFDKEGIEIPFPHRTVVFKKGRPDEKTMMHDESEASD